ncbi:MAG: GIY-YIG nuclease family protein [Methanomassiliicoccales archaeon]|nr:GIY-YIG nuclease family protein [Methanomassiliicoccales archaeon]NYT16276.1 GIY-YIG nuclease family protein [Methanomassiliicoccales archaeon]
MSLDWSEWMELNLSNVQKIPTQPGVYRIYDSEKQEMLYLGESSNLRMRIQSHSRKGWKSNAVFSYHSLPKSLPEYQRLEIENDLIGGYYLERIVAPRFQFGKK